MRIRFQVNGMINFFWRFSVCLRIRVLIWQSQIYWPFLCLFNWAFTPSEEITKLKKKKNRLFLFSYLCTLTSYYIYFHMEKQPSLLLISAPPPMLSWGWVRVWILEKLTPYVSDRPPPSLSLIENAELLYLVACRNVMLFLK